MVEAADGAEAMPAWLRARPNTTINGVLTEQVSNGTFATNNLSSWDTSGPVSASSDNPHGGSYAAKLGDQPGTTAELAQSSIRIPNVLNVGQLTYWWRSTSSDGTPDPDDRLIVEILDGSSVVVQVQNQANLGTQGWQQVTLDLRPYEGHWSTLHFKLTNDSDASVTAVWIDDVSLTVQPILPKFWDNAYLVPYNAFVQAMGSAFRNESRLEFVGMGTGEFGETRASDNVDDPATLAAGLDSQGWIATVNRITDMYVSAFSEGGRLRKTVMLQNAPFQYQPFERRDFSAYAATKDAGLSFNGLFYDWNSAVSYPYPNAGGAWRLKAYDPMIEYSGRVPTGFETYNYMVGNNTIPGHRHLRHVLLGCAERTRQACDLSAHVELRRMVPGRQRPARPSLHGHHGLGKALLRRLARRPHWAAIPAIGVGGDARPHVPDLLLQQPLRLRKRHRLARPRQLRVLALPV